MNFFQENWFWTKFLRIQMLIGLKTVFLIQPIQDQISCLRWLRTSNSVIIIWYFYWKFSFFYRNICEKMGKNYIFHRNLFKNAISVAVRLYTCLDNLIWMFQRMNLCNFEDTIYYRFHLLIENWGMIAEKI